MDEMVKFETEGENMKLFLYGRLNTTTVNVITESVLERIVGIKNVYLDIRGVEYISSSGLRLVLMILNELEDVGGTLTVSRASDAVMQVFEDTGFSSILDFEEE